jgi:hypothetical protein
VSFGSRPPKRVKGVLPWDLLKLSDRCWRGWLAGPPIWLQCHHLNATRPCKSALTDGALRCPLSHKQFFPRWRAYVPLWDESGTRCFTVVSDRYEEQLDRIVHLSPVLVGKQAAKGQPIKVWDHAWTKGPPPITKGETRPQDLRPYLLVLWNDPELKAWASDSGIGPLPPYRLRADVAADEVPHETPPAVADRLAANDLFAKRARELAERNGVK